ncbi:Glycogen synthase [Rosistilla ulvae]|uniref:Glycogen synthase n=1 Tax=Rosistilla ulvae TaxID=1930277 RepID=A0A517M2F6_9BACT|nr:glycosyltransferase family 4 protein [Rosistilla ulvae]QDS89055.1 Glycogen synthase [Rosistilla ulvae]
MPYANWNTMSKTSGIPYRNLILVVRADPIICGHSTEARNLAEAARAAGIENVHIVSYPLDVLAESGLPLKPLDSVAPYSPGIFVDRPEPVGDYKVLDGRLGYAIAGHLIDLVNRLPGRTAIMNLYLVPHGQMVMQSVETLRGMGTREAPATIAEAVGSDVTNVVANALSTGQLGAAAIVLQNYLAHDLPVAVSEYTRKLIIEAGQQVDERLKTTFAYQLESRVRISYPAIDTSVYLSVAEQADENASVLAGRGLSSDGFLLFLSRLSKAKGVDDLIHAYRASQLYGNKVLAICGTGPDADRLIELAAGDPNIRFFDDVGDEEKLALMHSCYAYCLPSKPRPEFTETFGIAIAEAMLSGGLGPVITTRTGGIPEATGDHCLYHAAGDVADLTSKLNLVASMSDWDRGGLSRAAQQYARRFDRAVILDRLLSAPAIRAVA